MEKKVDIKKAQQRAAAEPRIAPHFSLVRTCCAIGWRKRGDDSDGHWIARFGNGGSIKYITESLGRLDHAAPNQRWSEAVKVATPWFEKQERNSSRGKTSTSKTRITLGDACREHEAACIAEANLGLRSKTTLSKIARFYPQYIYSNPISNVRLHELEKIHLVHWREGIDAVVGQGRKTGKGKTVKRSLKTIDRSLNFLRAALTRASKNYETVDPKLWGEELKNRGKKESVINKVVYLTPSERLAVMNASLSKEAKAFFTALSELPLRPGAMAALVVENFSTFNSELTIGKDKQGNDRKIWVPEKFAKLIMAQSKDKLPKAPIFADEKGDPWNSQSWFKALRDAKQTDKTIPAKTTTYSFRHSTITDLIQLHGLDVYTVADIAGTSPQMIAQHYKHMLQGHAVSALEKLSVRS